MKHDEADRPNQAERVPLVEETLEARTVERQVGTVRIHKRVETRPEQVEVDVHRDEVSIERMPMDETVTERREPWYEDGVLMVPVYEEVPVTTMSLVLREVVRVTRSRRAERVTVEGEVRREVVDIEPESH